MRLSHKAIYQSLSFLRAGIEGFYNPSRRRAALGYLSPIEYESRSLPPGAPT